MKKVIIIGLLAQILWGSDDYLPVSKLTDEKKYEYGFLNKENQKELIQPKNNIETNGYEPIKETKVDVQEEIKIEKTELPKIVVEEKKLEIKEKDYKKEAINKEFLTDYKKENILKDSKVKNESSFARDFSITPKLTYSFLKSDIYITDRVSVVEERGVLIPEIALSYKNHTLKAEKMDSKAYFEKVLIFGGDLSIDSSWNKLSYLYKYRNANIGLAYNAFEVKGNFIFDQLGLDFYTEDKEEFPSLEAHFKNEENKLQSEYGVSYGKNNNLDYAYEYYINLGYKLLNDNLVVSAGYKNKTIEIDKVRFQYKGPMIGLSGTF